MEHHRRITNADGGSRGGCGGPSASDNKVKLMCSYGGKIQTRPDQTNKFMYVGGDTKLLTIDRNIKFSDIVKRLISLFSFETEDVCIKYQLPGEDLDVLISLINHDDLENMMVEYDRLHRILSPNNKPIRMRLFLSPLKSPAKPSSHAAVSDAPANPDYLFGFDKDCDYNKNNNNNQLPGIPTKSAFDLELWKIPCTVKAGKKSEFDKRVVNRNFNQNGNGVQEVIAHDGQVTGGVAKQQLPYRFPVMSVGLQLRQSGIQGLALKMGMMNGNCREKPMYNFVPTIPSVPEQMKSSVTAVDMSGHDANVITELR